MAEEVGVTNPLLLLAVLLTLLPTWADDDDDEELIILLADDDDDDDDVDVVCCGDGESTDEDDCELDEVFQSGTMPDSAEEHWLWSRRSPLLLPAVELLLLVLLPPLLLLTDIIECGRLLRVVWSDGEIAIEFLNLGAARKQIKHKLP